MTIEWVDIHCLQPHPKNRNKHSIEQIERLSELIRYQGWRHPIIVSEHSGYVVAGHGRLEAAKKLGLLKVPIHTQDFLDDDQEYAFLVSDNAIASWAELDLSGINSDIGELGPEFDINLLGIKDFVLEPADKFKSDPDEVPEVTESICKLGELYQLGNHRLLVGDCTVKENVDRLMGGEEADMVFTDPPYGMNLDTEFSSMKGSTKILVGNKGNSYSKVIGDAEDYDPTPLFELFDYVREMFLFGADYYAERLKDKNAGSWIVWDKRQNDALDDLTATSADRAFGSAFELCWSKAKHKRTFARIRSGVFGVKNEDGTSSRCHPTQKPVQLTEWFFENWGKETKLVWDGYLGSGSTLIACEKTNRRCYGMEIDPHYCDVIIARWEKFTGKKAAKLN